MDKILHAVTNMGEIIFRYHSHGRRDTAPKKTFPISSSKYSDTDRLKEALDALVSTGVDVRAQDSHGETISEAANRRGIGRLWEETLQKHGHNTKLIIRADLRQGLRYRASDGTLISGENRGLNTELNSRWSWERYYESIFARDEGKGKDEEDDDSESGPESKSQSESSCHIPPIHDYQSSINPNHPHLLSIHDLRFDALSAKLYCWPAYGLTRWRS
ncbi:hypothetical protein FPQ18DRAFT_308365 [Pyronema domesticum]|nr:hypothetical protein FPQ18DRAFT_308365 [Pyronema domesticum]